MIILVCLECNNGDLDRRVTRVALKHAESFHAEVIVFNSQMLDDRFHSKEVEAGREGLESARRFFEVAGLGCKSHHSIRGMEPGEDIEKFADENGVDVIYLGLKKRSRLGKLLVGSTAQYLLLKSKYTIVSVK